MKLRTRLVVATIGVTVPMVLGLLWLDGRARHHAAEAALTDAAFRRVDDPEERARCQADPARRGRPREPTGGPGGPPSRPGGPPSGAGADHRRPPPPPEGHRPRRGPRPPFPGGVPPMFFAYDAQLRSTHPAAPVLDPALISVLDRDGSHALSARWYDDDVVVVVRAPGSDNGACTYVLAHGTTTPGFLGALLPASPIWLLPLAAVLIAILVAVGPVIGRIRRLTVAVERAAASGFAGPTPPMPPIPVEGNDELAVLARAFDAAGREVAAQLAAKDQRERALRDFLANTTHDVMIPLTVLQAHLANLREQANRGTVASLELVTSAMDEAHYIGALLHNLAVAAKLDAGEPGLLRGPVDLGALVARVVSRHAPIARQRSIALEHAVPELPLATDADVTLLEQAVSNVVYNAIRHNRTGGHVALILEEQPAARFRVRVLDDGPGIAPAQLDRMLERGARGDQARSRVPDGQGLGLDIAHRVARLHGLDLRFSASEFGGLQVDLEGPALPAASGEAQDGDAAPSSRRNASITSA